VVPYKAVSKDNDGKHSFLLSLQMAPRVIKQNITVGNYGESGIEVLSGLTPGQVVVAKDARSYRITALSVCSMIKNKTDIMRPQCRNRNIIVL